MGPESRDRRPAESGPADAVEGRTSAAAVLRWLALRAAEGRYRVKVVPLSEIEGWVVDPETGDVAHTSGRFFRIQGVAVHTADRHELLCEQPIINQPETGIVGFIAQWREGVPWLLAQAKMEPGNINLVQLSPTVQATHSNYSRVHGGAVPAYFEHFIDRPLADVIVDEVQSEQGSRFYRKRNRTMVVEVTASDALDVQAGFEWLPVSTVIALLDHDNIVNMNARSVLASLWASRPDITVSCPGDRFASLVNASATAPIDDGAHTLGEIETWLDAQRAERRLVTELVPMRDLHDWVNDGVAIRRRSRGCLVVLGVDVMAGGREVPAWQQPLIASQADVNVLACQVRRGVLHVLMQARAEPGTRDGVELGPTVTRTCGGAFAGDPDTSLDRRVMEAPAGQVRYDRMLSEEGGRFYHVQNRYRIVEIDAGERFEVPAGYRWITLAQLRHFIRCGGSVNIEARTLAACLLATTVRKAQ